MTWTGQSFSYGQVLTSTQMNNLQADITAQANGDSGAPQQQNAGIAANAVHQAELYTTQNVASVAVSGESEGYITPTNTQFILSQRARGGIANDFDPIGPIGSGHIGYLSASYTVPRFYFYNNDTTIRTAYCETTYVLASPPHDLGDGKIPLFVFAMIEKSTGNILRTSQDIEPPWGHALKGGKHVTDKDGNQTVIQDRRIVRGLPLTLKQAIDAGRMDEYCWAFRDAENQSRNITQAEKNAAMNKISHPFLGDMDAHNANEVEIVMLNPFSDAMQDLSAMREHDETYAINELIHEGYLVIDNEQSGIKGPQGILVPNFRWKNTRAPV